MKKNRIITLAALATTFTLAACGGGGDSGSTTPTSSNNAGSSGGGGSTLATVPGTLASPQYAADSAQLAAFNRLNQSRTQCGFPTLQQNTVLDQAAQAHAQYQGVNGVVTDTEIASNQGFVGATYVDRAAHFGAPSSVFGTGVSAAYYTNATLPDAQYGENLVTTWLSGVYHSPAVLYPSRIVGIGVSKTTYNGFPDAWGSMSFLDTEARSVSGAPLTFPCEGVTGVAYGASGEIPAPPNVSASGWGTPVTVMGNLGDTVSLQSASVTGPSGSVAVQILNADSDPNKLLGKYQAVAYPTTPLAPNTTYSVTITGTVNGTAFSRNFSFKTGNVVG
ncbi:serine protease [Burkholderia diffusa]|uniref:Serine protease n=1 Tax=Burkholderia diffusa TaxID=488732 RepID=A0AAW3PCC3_9BURK|nr:CAP domain-containing protein [Burkholderia diffusa]KWF35833.1 serine protease [Burkholderia diffusa]KWF39195.1 serine protease [Burkholderia diffusa]KWF40957.1 serine protease [Burkholderia diffusa]KWF49326.1 serine protease [Burkholderia diffusa]